MDRWHGFIPGRRATNNMAEIVSLLNNTGMFVKVIGLRVVSSALRVCLGHRLATLRDKPLPEVSVHGGCGTSERFSKMRTRHKSISMRFRGEGLADIDLTTGCISSTGVIAASA